MNEPNMDELEKIHDELNQLEKSLPQKYGRRVSTLAKLLNQEIDFCAKKILLGALSQNVPRALTTDVVMWLYLIEHLFREGRLKDTLGKIERLISDNAILQRFWEDDFEKVLVWYEEKGADEIAHGFYIRLMGFAEGNGFDIIKDNEDDILGEILRELGIEPVRTKTGDYQIEKMMKMAGLVWIPVDEFNEYMDKYFMPLWRKKLQEKKDERWVNIGLIKKEEVDETKMKNIQQYNIKHLALLYAETVKKSGNESPSQQELERTTTISQSTWSRSFRKKEFWDYVKKELNDLADTVNKRLNDTEENKNKIIQALRIAEDKADASKQRYVSNKEISNMVDKIADNSTIQPDEELDDENINKISKTQLINEILSLRPESKKEELESKTVDELKRLFKVIN